MRLARLLLRYSFSLALASLLAFTCVGSGAASAQPIRLKIVGGLADVEQYTAFEAPFWTQRVPLLTAGAVQAEIAPFDRSGIRGQDLPRLVRLGVTPFANVLLAVSASDDAELDVLNLPLANGDLGELATTAARWQPRLAALIRERYGAELLAIYTYPAQVIMCRGPFQGLDDLAGRRVRTSSVAQAELMTALGATPVVIPFAEAVPAMRDGVVQCAITGALSANSIGLANVATHISARPVNWGVSAFIANTAAWQALPASIREQLRNGLRQLQDEIWQSAGRAEAMGMLCNTGQPACRGGTRGRMQAVEEPAQVEFRRLLLREVVLPGWWRRCGQSCEQTWNSVAVPPSSPAQGAR